MNDFAIDISPLVPASYAVYRPVIADAFGFFLSHLSPHRQEEIHREQSRLPPEAGLRQRFTSLIRCCPSLHKLGQVMARDRRLDPALRRWLQTLESLPPGPVKKDVSRYLGRQLAGFDTAGVRVGQQAVAEASVAVVVPFSWSPRSGDEAVSGVFKVLKPGIDARLAEELEIWAKLGAYIDGRCGDDGLPEIQYAETLTSVGRLLAGEIHLDREQAHMGEAAALYRGDSVTVPRLLPFCTPGVTAMERVDGAKVTEVDGMSSRERLELADKVAESLIARPLWNRRDPSLFHADPHAGNLFRRNDGTLVILDWSLVGRLGKGEREQMVQILLGALRRDRVAVARAIDALAESGVRGALLRDVVDKAVGGLLTGGLPGFHWLLTLLDDVALQGAANFGQSLVVFRKSILTLSGVLADITAEDRVEPVMRRTGLSQIIREWPVRGWASPDSRSFGSHISNLDLLSLYWALPEVSRRVWWQWLDSGRSGSR